MVKTPKFWYRNCWFTPLLAPLGWGYSKIIQTRRKNTSPYKCSVPVICVGNLVMGGAGKTPTVIALVALLKDKGYNPHILSRGYKGKVAGNTRVDPTFHTFRDVGDEPLLLALHAPTWVGKNRPLSAKLAIEAGADLLIMDDGLQNPSLYQDIKLVVVDANQGFGNGYVFPAGPLREEIGPGLERIDGVVMINGHGDLPIDKPTFPATIAVKNKIPYHKVIGFAGLGFPEKFRRTLLEEGYDVLEFHEFPDHYVYKEDDLLRLVSYALEKDAQLVTTMKDYLRISPKWHSHILTLDIDLKMASPEVLLEFLSQKLM